MPRTNPLRPFAPDAAQMALKPEIAGNTINGLGEAQVRRPRLVYWATDPDTIPHGRMQRWFYQVDPGNPHIARAREARAQLLQAPLPEVRGDPVRQAPASWNRGLAGFVEDGHCELWGVTRLDPDWVYEDQVVTQQTLLVIGVAHDYEQIATAPAATAGAEVVRQYGRAAAAAKAIAGWIRLQGWEAEPLTGPMTSQVAMIPAALACGFGELGKHGSIIHPRYGSSFRLSAVLTDAPFEPTPPSRHGIDEFCLHCRVCEDACPPEAIAPHKQLVRGTLKWYVDFDRCLPFFNQTHGCAICIAACPWSRPGVGLNLAEKLARRAALRPAGDTQDPG
jgi:epoxyqueuosine reductase